MKRFAITCILTMLFVRAGVGCSVVVLPSQVARTFTIDLKHGDESLEMPISISDTRTGSVVRHVKTDAHGHVEIRDLEPGIYNVVSPASNDEVEVLPKGGLDVLRIAARFNHAPIEVAQLRVTITDATDAVIPRSVVVLEAVDDWRSPVAAGTTDELGSIALQAPEGEYQLRIARQGFQTVLVPVRVTKSGWSGFTLALQVGGCPGRPPVPLSIKPKE